MLRALNAQRKVVMDLLKDGKLEEAQKASDELEKMTKEYDELPEDNLAGKAVNVMNEKDKMKFVKKAVDAFIHKGWSAITDEQKQYIKPVNATDTPGQVENTTIASKGAALVPVSTADFALEMDSGVYRLRDRVFNYFANTKSGKIPIVGNPTDTLTNFDEYPSGGMHKTDVTINSVDFNVADVGDIVPVSNDLVADELASVYDIIMNVFLKKLRNTENKLILGAIDGAVVAEAVHTWQEIATAVNETDPVDGTDKIIITNTDGGAFLQNQVDNDHYVLIQPNMSSPKKYFRGYEVIQMPLSILPNDALNDNAIPFYVGSLYNGIVFVERQGLVVTYNPYGEGFAKNATDVRITARLDCKPAFTGALKKLLYTPSED